ncbi:MAG: CocE/NonD family hydrolase [Firmicutes bacterium]|nr:CocE/NonD family hydrolase [Candidatus Fermentithermobacillaceae bacterium]
MLRAVTYQIPAKGGAVLATDVYLPPEALPCGRDCPALVVRTPYGRKNLSALGDFFARNGYAVVVQDVRGTGESGGTFGFLSQEPPDAEETARWILSQPWCNGTLGIIGVSYLASASIAIASLFPEQVKAAVWVTIPVSADTLTWQGGALRLHHALPWVLIQEGKLQDVLFPQAYSTLPVAGILPRGTSSLWEALISDGPGSRFWHENDVWDYVKKCRVPGLHFGGWFDFLLDATLRPYQEMSSSEVPQRLVLGPWSHNGILGRTKLAGGVDYGPGSGASFGREALAWFDRWLKGKESGVNPDESCCGDGQGYRHTYREDESCVRCFFTGSEPGWREYRKWPPEGAVLTRFYLSANGLVRDPEGEASGAARGNEDWAPEEGRHTYIYDPLDPVPTEGGALWEFPRAGLVPGPVEQHSHLREDVLVYDTPPLDNPLRVAGPVTLVLYAASSCPDTDFTGKLVDVDENGTPRIVTDGIVRARYRNGFDRPELLEPGKVAEFRISLGACAHVFGKGHRVRLEISSSNFPKYDRNMNTEKLPWLEDRAVKARQEVYFGLRTPSRLELYLEN